VSENNFPTAAGLASSAAGFAALIRAVADLYQLPSSPAELSKIARQGSGSACRSLFGGYVAWEAGSASDGSDSLAVPVQPTSHWPAMKALILVASAKKKDVSSTAGMQATVATSALFSARVDKVVPERMSQMATAIKDRDFSTFGELTMRDSNSFHATCADTWPPIFYMNDTSRAAVRLVEAVNEVKGKIICAYTFDAGPNAVIFYEDHNADFVEKSFRKILGHVDGWKAGIGKAAPSEALPTPKKETPQWLSKFSEALTIDAPNEREAPAAEEPAAPVPQAAQSQKPQSTPKPAIAAPDWLRLAASSLTENSEAPSHNSTSTPSTTDVIAAANTAANTAVSTAASVAKSTAAATPAWLNKFAEALTTDAPSMREEGDDSSAGAGAEGKPVSVENNNAKVGSKSVGDAAVAPPGWLNRFAEALTKGAGNEGHREAHGEQHAEEETKASDISAEVVQQGEAKNQHEDEPVAKEATSYSASSGVDGKKGDAASGFTKSDKAGEKKAEIPSEGEVKYDERVVAALREGVSRVIMTGVGEGPKSTRDHLIDEDGGVENRYSF
jgi:diphosphomevalonate decarboxylase